MHARVDDGLRAHAGGLASFSGLPTVQFRVAFLHTASDQKLDCIGLATKVLKGY